MNLFRKRQVQTLPEWLKIATRKLTDASKERIRVEIEAHYAEAVETHRENGLSEADAQSKALGELGDAKAAARRFRKQHLTQREEQWVKGWEKMWRSVWWLILWYFVFGQCVLGQLLLRPNAYPFHYKLLGVGLEFLVWVALPTICFAFTRFGKTKPNRNLVLVQLVSGFPLGAFLNHLFMPRLLPLDDWSDALFGLFLLYYFLLVIRIWIKLEKTGPIQSQTPPQNPAPA